MALWKRRGADLPKGGKSAKHRLGLALSALIVGVALLGPTLSGQSVPAFTAIRHEVLTLDRELEGVSGWCVGPTRSSEAISGAATRGRNTV